MFLRITSILNYIPRTPDWIYDQKAIQTKLIDPLTNEFPWVEWIITASSVVKHVTVEVYV